MLAQDIICKKRHAGALTHEEIDYFIQGINDWSISDGQIAALLMACVINGLTTDEISAFVFAIIETGIVLDWDSVDLNGPVTSLYTMPSVGDKAELIVPPLLAACGVYVPMICERVQYQTGGTIDKIESIQGFNAHPTLSVFKKTMRESGCAFMTATDQIIPADIRIQAIRDVSATVNSIGLMVISLMVKQLACGIKNLTVDVCVDSGSFTPTKEHADICAQTIKTCSQAFGINSEITFSELDHLVGVNLGNALEVYEAWAYLTSTGPRNSDLHEQVKRISAISLLQNGVASTIEDAYHKIDRALTSGQAAECFGRMLFEQGVDASFITNPAPFLPMSNVVRPVFADKEGFVSDINLRWLGLAALEMGAGRFYQEQKIDYAAGYSNVCSLGMYVSNQVPLAFVHADSEEIAERACTHLKGAITVSEQA